MALIDIGPGATGRASAVSANITFIDLNNSANASGILDTIEIWSASSLSGCKVGTFYLDAGTTYVCRDAETIGNVTSGSKQTFTPVSLAVETGDFLGIFYSGGTIERDHFGAGYYTKSGDYVTASSSESYSLTASRTISIYATGEGGTVLGLAGTINGVSSVTGAIGANPVTVAGLAGTSAGTSNVTGAIGANPVSVLGLAGTSAGTSSVTGAIGANPVSVSGLAGTIAGVSSVTGAVRKIATLYLTGTVTGVSSVTGAIGVNPVVVSSLAGVIAGISSVTGSVLLKGEDVILSFPSTRASDYDPDLVWDEDTGTWTSDEDLLRRDGSRHKTQLVCVGKDLIYYGEID